VYVQDIGKIETVNHRLHLLWQVYAACVTAVSAGMHNRSFHNGNLSTFSRRKNKNTNRARWKILAALCISLSLSDETCEFFI